MCIQCYHHKDRHERIQKYYKKYDKEKSISPDKKRKIDNEILELQNNLNNINEIQEAKKSALERTEKINKNLEYSK